MESKIKNVNFDNARCSPINNIFSNIKIMATGNLNEKNLNELYRCNLCNNCHMAGFNKGARSRAVNNHLIMPHLTTIKENINNFGNPYGINHVREGNDKEKKETILFRGCTSSYKTPESLESALRLINKLDISYDFIDNETCCGNILFNLGDEEAGYEIVKKNIEEFKAAGVERIITICPGCYNAFNKYYKGFNDFNPEILLAIDLMDDIKISEDFLVQNPCHAKEKNHKVHKILGNSKNENINQCCGAGGGVIAYDEQTAISRAIKTIENSTKKIITYCPFCYLNLSSVNPDAVIDLYTLLNNNTP